MAEIEHLRAADEYEGSREAARKTVRGDENFSQWTAFGLCAATCGRSIQTRTRYCMPGKICSGKTLETRTCIQTPCPGKMFSVCLFVLSCFVCLFVGNAEREIYTSPKIKCRNFYSQSPSVRALDLQFGSPEFKAQPCPYRVLC